MSIDKLSKHSSQWLLYKNENNLVVSFIPNLDMQPNFDASSAMWTINGRVPYLDGLDANLNRSSIPIDRLQVSLILHKDYVDHIDDFPWLACKGFKPLLNIKQVSLWGITCWDIGHPVEIWTDYQAILKGSRKFTLAGQ